MSLHKVVCGPFYLKNPNILVPGTLLYTEANELKESHPSASVVFATSTIELFLKAALLKPVIYGLVHNEPLAEIIVKTALGQTGFNRYKKLLAKLFMEIAEIDINDINRIGSTKSLLIEAEDIQKIRNKIIHQGELVTVKNSYHAITVAEGILHNIVEEMLLALGLLINSDGIVLKNKDI